MDHPGGTLYGKVVYHEIEAPERLTYTQMFSDEKKGPGRHPMLPVFPDKMHTTVLFVQEANGQTRVSVTWRPEGQVSAEELAEFVKARDGMTVGWTGSFDKLESWLEELKAARGQADRDL